MYDLRRQALAEIEAANAARRPANLGSANLRALIAQEREPEVRQDSALAQLCEAHIATRGDELAAVARWAEKTEVTSACEEIVAD